MPRTREGGTTIAAAQVVEISDSHFEGRPPSLMRVERHPCFFLSLILLARGIDSPPSNPDSTHGVQSVEATRIDECASILFFTELLSIPSSLPLTSFDARPARPLFLSFFSHRKGGGPHPRNSPFSLHFFPPSPSLSRSCIPKWPRGPNPTWRGDVGRRRRTAEWKT